MKRLLLLAVLPAMLFAPDVASALTLEWDRNAEIDMKEYYVYVCKTVGCTSTNVGLDWFATVPQPAVGVKPSVVLPINVAGGVSVVAADTAGNSSGPSVSLPFTTVPAPVDLPPGAPKGLTLKP